MRQVAHINAMNDLEPTEMNIEGTFFDVEYMLRLAEARRVGLWHWQDWETAMAYRDGEWWKDD